MGTLNSRLYCFFVKKCKTEGVTTILKVPAGSSSGTRLRIKGHGVKLPKVRQGDLYAELQIVLPASMSQDDLTQLEKLAERYPLDPRANLTW